MKKEQKKCLKCKGTRHRAQKEKGITLIALVITIILLLILAGVTLKIVIDNNFVDKAQTAVEKYSRAQARENLEIALLNYKIGQLTGEEKTLQEYLEEAKITVSNKEGEDYTVEIKGYEFKINEKTLEIEETTKTEPSEPEETKYKLTLKVGDYIETVTGEGTYKEGEKITINATLAEKVLGYSDNKFVNWTSSNTNLIADNETQNLTITMPKGDVTLTANAQRGTIKTLKGIIYTGVDMANLKDIGTIDVKYSGYGTKYKIIFQSGGYTINVSNSGIANQVRFTNLSGSKASIVYQSGPSTSTNISPYNITEQGELDIIANNGNIKVELTVTSTGEKVPLEFEGYRIQMNSNGGSFKGNPIYTRYVVEKGKSITISNSYYNYVARDGFTLLGYSEDQNATTATYAKDATITPTKDMTLYAVWQEN